MISETILPRPQAQFIDGAGRPTRQFYDFLRSLIQLIQSVNGDTSAIADLLARVEALEAGGGSDAIIQGLMSVAVNGTLAGGVVQVLLQGDVQSPGNTYYYGSDADGVRGWFPVADALDVTPDLTIAVGSDGVITFGLADVPDAGGGTLQKTAFDTKGRKTGTSAATTDDLPEGETNLYFTNERAQDAVGDAIAAGTGDGVALSYDDAGNAIDAANTDKGSVAVADHVAQSDPHPQYVENAEKGVSNGIATLDSSAKLQANQLPALAITETFVVNSEAAMLAAPAQQGDVAVRTDLTKSFILTADPASTLANWQELLHPYSGGTVTSVGLSMPSVFTVSGSPVTSSGTLFVALASQSAGLVWASPSGSAGAPVFRLLVESDIPSLNWSKITAGKPTTLSGYGITDALPSSAIVQSITDGDTTHVPSGDAVFDALAGKADDAKLTVIAGLSANQALANATTTKVNLNTESVDTDGCFDPGTGRFTPTKSGVYLVISTIPFGYVSGTITSGQRLITYVYLNGAQYTAITGGTNNSATNIIQAIALVPMNGATDYLEMYARRDTTAEYQINSGSAGAQFSAIRISA